MIILIYYIKMKQFLTLAGVNPECTQSDRLFYFDLTSLSRYKRGLREEQELLKYVVANPQIIQMKITDDHTVFDFYFDCAIKVVRHTHSDFWKNALITIIGLLPDDTDIMHNHSYIYRLQSGINNHNEIFKYMIECSNFTVADMCFLVYSIIARGELEKLRILGGVVELEVFPAIFDVALKHGRYEILWYLIDELEIDITKYGKVLDLPLYPTTHKLMFYRNDLSSIGNTDVPIIESKQNYEESLKTIMKTYTHQITINTLDAWAEVVRTKLFAWDVIDFKTIVEVLRPCMTEPIPLSHDFKEFNSIVFGREWSDRACIIEYCKNLEDRCIRLENRMAGTAVQEGLEL